MPVHRHAVQRWLILANRRQLFSKAHSRLSGSLTFL
jgi:hypothetical protein